MKYSWFVLVLLISSARMKGKKVDLIIHNAKIHCMDDQNTVEDAMAIKDGKVVYYKSFGTFIKNTYTK